MFDRRLFLVLALLLFAANLRTPITAISPLFPQLSESLGLTNTSTGLLASLPLLIFAIASPIVGKVAIKLGISRLLGWALCLLNLGFLLRAAGSISALYIGTLFCAIGIALGNVLLPSWLKAYFPAQARTLTAWYALTMGLSAAAFAALSVPLAHHWGWQLALAAPFSVALLSAICWYHANRITKQTPVVMTHKFSASHSVWKNPIAWQVSAYMGLCSLTFYIVINWLPAILQDQGISATQAGVLHGGLQIAGALAGLLLSYQLKHVSLPVIASGHAVLVGVGMMGLLFIPQWPLLWCLLLGYSGGGVFIIALTLLSTVPDTAAESASLSGMSQSLGYLIASTGPILAGTLHEYWQSWVPVQWLFIMVCLIMAVLGLCASRHHHLNH